jgi:hypothetical protein
MGQGAAFYIYGYIANFRNLHNSMMSKTSPRPAPLPQTHGDLVEIINLKISKFKIKASGLGVIFLPHATRCRMTTLPHCRKMRAARSAPGPLSTS